MKSFDKKTFSMLYFACFDTNDNIKTCGRDVCIELLQFLNDPCYGNADTGYLNIATIVALKKSVLDGDTK